MIVRDFFSLFLMSGPLRNSIRNYKIKGGYLWHYFQVMFASWRNKTDFPHDMAIGAIVKNEALYILEWIEYHRLLGVSKFYIYDNGSTDNLCELLTPYVSNGIVELTPWNNFGTGTVAMQVAAYNDIVDRHKLDARWLAFIDIDEFITLPSGGLLADFMKEFSGESGLIINWLCYGDGGMARKTDGLVIERFRDHSTPELKKNMHIKSIVNPRKVVYMDAHCADVCGRKMVDSSHKRVLFTHKKKGVYDKIYVAHYLCKTYEEFCLRAGFGRIDNKAAFDARNAGCNEIKNDPIMDKYVRPVKKAIARAIPLHL